MVQQVFLFSSNYLSNRNPSKGAYPQSVCSKQFTVHAVQTLTTSSQTTVGPLVLHTQKTHSGKPFVSLEKKRPRVTA